MKGLAVLATLAVAALIWVISGSGSPPPSPSNIAYGTVEQDGTGNYQGGPSSGMTITFPASHDFICLFADFVAKTGSVSGGTPTGGGSPHIYFNGSGQPYIPYVFGPIGPCIGASAAIDYVNSGPTTVVLTG